MPQQVAVLQSPENPPRLCGRLCGGSTRELCYICCYIYDEKGAREAKEPQSPVYRGDDDDDDNDDDDDDDDDDNDNEERKNRGFFTILIALPLH